MARIVNKKTGRVLAENNRDKQELWCMECENYVQFPLDLTLNGNHMFDCPNCGHTHYRFVEDGRITSTRWNPRYATHQIAQYAATTTLSNATLLTYTSNATGWGSATTYTTYWLTGT